MDWSRRALVATACSIGTVGCLSGILPEEPPVLNCLSVINRRSEPLAVDIEIEHDGEIVSDQTIEIGGREDNAVERKWVTPTWPTDPEPFTVRASLRDHDESERLDSSDLPQGVPIHESLIVTRESELAFFHRDVSEPSEQCRHAGENRALDNSSSR